ncbi:MAG: CPBP family intramembrane metalloprotease [Oscillospiraceae bacterium]|nr:CPBP family intramembrane metalloprotease [Oscillospiraceae bacterium]
MNDYNNYAAEKSALRKTVSIVAGIAALFFFLDRFSTHIFHVYNLISDDLSDLSELVFGDRRFFVAFLSVFIHTICLSVCIVLALTVLRQWEHFKFSMRKINSPNFGKNEKNSERHTNLTVPAVLISIGMLFTSGTIAGLSGNILGWFGITLPQNRSTGTYDGILWLIFELVATAVIPALFEEALFRGAVMGSLRRFGDGFALFVSSVLFALAHLNVGLMSVLNAFVFALVLGYFAIRTGSLRIAMLMHFMFNLAVIILERVQWLAEIDFTQNLTGSQGTNTLFSLLMPAVESVTNVLYYAFVPLCLILGIAGLVMFLRRCSKPFVLNDNGCRVPLYDRLKVTFVSPVMMCTVLFFSSVIVYNIIDATIRRIVGEMQI